MQVRVESGEILQRRLSVSAGDFFQADSAAYPLLSHVVPWADTAFNRSQVAALAAEIDRYEADAAVNLNGESFDWLRQMCEVTAEEPHRMLWFVGD
ncbi:hypothetical protein I3F60_24725 [Streptomyces sp. MUM 136J]|uniref:hypothetical protein n=1 Tax=Streptomyces sp. MUM 136J TaxID=2791992 RepID=UPI001F037642|nr:hypothetical protein [Streptomyces sp. MUM 136J]MCH0572416.1 hypothetical protein [Streptomyces sp. MUM 136J]